MRTKRYCLFLLSIFVFVLFTNTMVVNAMNTGFETSSLPSEEKTKFISGINLLPLNEEPGKTTIMSFDVNSNRLIAIGQNTSSRKRICVYSDEGVFQYGYTFNCTGDFGVEWDDENLNIFFVRSDVIVSVTPSGEVLDALEVQDTIENNSYVYQFIHSTKRVVGDTEYFLGNDLGILNLFSLSYSQITVKDSVGTENVIYDVGSTQLYNAIGNIGFLSLFIFAAVIAWRVIKLSRGN